MTKINELKFDLLPHSIIAFFSFSSQEIFRKIITGEKSCTNEEIFRETEYYSENRNVRPVLEFFSMLLMEAKLMKKYFLIKKVIFLC